MTQKRIFFTGGSGKAGKHMIPYLIEQGHRVMNVDLVPLDCPGVDNLSADITDSGQMFNAMSPMPDWMSWSRAMGCQNLMWWFILPPCRGS